MTKQEKLEAIRRAVWLATHPYAENHVEMLKKDDFGIGRVMAAIKERNLSVKFYHSSLQWFEYDLETDRNLLVESKWQLLKEDGGEATLEDQTEEVLEKLYQLLK